MPFPDLRGVVPACITPFTADGNVDHPALAAHVRWLAECPGVKGVACLGHAGEGLSLTERERVDVVSTIAEAVGGKIAVIAGIGGEGTMVAAREAQRAAEAGADGALVYPAHGWLRFGFQPGAPLERYRAIADASGLPMILFQYPDSTLASYDLETQLQIAGLPEVFATKNGVRNMRRWDTEIPVLRSECPDLQVLTCHDEYLLHTMFDVDGALVGYGALAPESITELLEAGHRRDYPAARATHDRLLPLTKALYHRSSHMEATAALKLGLVHRGNQAAATVRPPLQPLEIGAGDDIRRALKHAGLA